MLIQKSHFSAAALLLFLAGVQAQHSVTLPSQNLCAVTGSTVNIPCTLTKPSYSSVTQREWYRVQSPGGEEQVLSKDQRVSASSWWSDCTLTMKNVILTDSGVYNFRFRSNTKGWISAPAGVPLTVTGLQVMVDPSTVGQREVKMTCNSTCTPRTSRYYWYKNGVEMHQKYTAVVLVSTWSYNEGSYSCAVYESSTLSPPACVLGKRCWGVTYTPDQVCALKGTTIDLPCAYKHPAGHTVTKSVWFIKAAGEPVDVMADDAYQDRLQHTHNFRNDCGLRISNLRETDARTYWFRFDTERSGGYTGQPGVSLSVTDLKVEVTRRYDERTLLSCITTCALSNNPTYIWYKDGQRVSYTQDKYLYLYDSMGSYNCTISGHEDRRSLAVYSPMNTVADVVSGDALEGGAVTLSCSSDANPPVLSYSWFKTGTPDTPLTKEQLYSINNLGPQHSGLYYCTAHNLLGHHDSTPVHLDVLYLPKNTTAEVLPSGDALEGGAVTLSCSSDANPPVLTYSWFKTGAPDRLLTTDRIYTISNLDPQHSGFYYCTAHNLLGHHDSTPAHLDVLYAPRNTSVTVIPSADRFVLSCSSDSNPRSSFAWYWKTSRGAILTGNGTNFTLSPGSPEGFYYCVAENRFGSSSSSEWARTSDSGVKHAAAGFTTVTLVVLALLGLVMVFRRRRGSLIRSRTEEGDVRASANHAAPNHAGLQNDSTPVYGNVAGVAPDDDDDVQYCSVEFRPSRPHHVPLYSTVDLPRDEKEEVEYSTVSHAVVREDELYGNLRSTE